MTYHRNEQIDSMRTICTYLVILGHILVFFTANKSVIPFKNDMMITSLQEALYTFHIPAFFFISGFVYNNHRSIQSFIIAKLKRLIVPYFLTYIGMVMPTLMVMGIWKWEFLLDILTNTNSRHLWFLYTLAMTLIFVRLFDFLPKWFCLILSIFIYIYGFKEFGLPFHFSNALVYVYLGIIYPKEFKMPLFIIMPFFILGLCYGESYPLIQGVLGCIMIYELSDYIKINDKNQFDMYLFHAMIIYLIFYFFKNSLMLYPNVFVILCVFVITIVASKLLSYIKHKILMSIRRIYKMFFLKGA